MPTLLGNNSGLRSRSPFRKKASDDNIIGKKNQSTPKTNKKGVYPVILRKEDPTKSMAYINLTLLDASDAVYQMVHSKMQQKQSRLPGPQAINNFVSNKVAKAASRNIPPSKIAEQLSKKLPKKLMYMMYHETGMKLAAQTVFVEDSYVVMQLQVQYVDSMRLLSKAKEGPELKGEEEKQESRNDSGNASGEDDEASVSTQVLDEWIEEQSQLIAEEENSLFVASSMTVPAAQKKIGLLDCFKNATSIREVVVGILEWVLCILGGTKIHRSLEERHLPSLVQSKITENMQSMMTKKLESKSLKADIAVLSETEQARYFYKHLQELRNKDTNNISMNDSSSAPTTAEPGSTNLEDSTSSCRRRQ